MDRETVKLKINNYIELRKSLLTLIIVLTSGTVALLLNLDSLIKIVLFIVGIVLNYFFIICFVDSNKSINKLLIDTEKEV
jgi:hypothetical protein